MGSEKASAWTDWKDEVPHGELATCQNQSIKERGGTGRKKKKWGSRLFSHKRTVPYGEWGKKKKKKKGEGIT